MKRKQKDHKPFARRCVYSEWKAPTVGICKRRAEVIWAGAHFVPVNECALCWLLRLFCMHFPKEKKNRTNYNIHAETNKIVVKLRMRKTKMKPKPKSKTAKETQKKERRSRPRHTHTHKPNRYGATKTNFVLSTVSWALNIKNKHSRNNNRNTCSLSLSRFLHFF